MKRRVYLLTVSVVIVLSQLTVVAYQKPKTDTPTASVTGTYKHILNTLDVLELPDHKVRISFAGYYPNDRRRAETRNVGAFDETVTLHSGTTRPMGPKGYTATVKIQFGDSPCVITLKFLASKALVELDGSLMGCGFGFNVEPDGTYTKVSSKPPDLPPVKK